MERWREPWESEEEKEIFVSNVMQQTEGEERVLCGNQLASRLLSSFFHTRRHLFPP